MNIVIFEAEPWESELFHALCDGHSTRVVESELSSDNASDYEDVEIISPFIYSSLEREVLQRLPNLQLIATRSTGYDHIAMDYCAEKGITVSNVPTYGDNTVAEHVFALLLSIARKMPQAIDRTRRGDFSMEGLRGLDLRGKTFGVIGTGSIGQRVIEIARGFGMKVIAFDVSPDDELAVNLGFTYVKQRELLENSDVISLHVPANDQTNNLLSTDEFESMKRGVIILNTARGSVVDTQALLRALSKGKVAGAGLDVLDEEPTIREEAELLRSIFRKEHHLDRLLADHVLMHMRNVVVTPHIGFDTEEAVRRIVETTLANINGYCRNEPQNVVGKEK